MSRVTREIRALKRTQSETQEEQDIELRSLKEFSRSIDTMLHEVAESDPDLNTILQRYFEQVLSRVDKSASKKHH